VNIVSKVFDALGKLGAIRAGQTRPLRAKGIGFVSELRNAAISALTMGIAAIAPARIVASHAPFEGQTSQASR
jgi:hypothetical protein